MDDDMRKTSWQKDMQEIPAERKMRENKNGKERSKRNLINEIDCKNEDILYNIGHIEQLEQYLLIRKRWCILALAENFEKLCTLGEYKEPLYTVDRSIYKLAQEYGLSVAQNWIHEILPSKYKQPMIYLSLYNADELGELLASTLLSRFPPPTSSPLVTTTIEEKGDKRAGVKRGDPYQALKTNYEG
jgi:hypothetical protein